ncbi:MAG: o-succinylbenzoate synthase [Gammaproteobacteria bacterium]|jgi:o-succinylbenzoate synthase|nr:o-succinylbenzoate synthase [Gammaproteobacteria bacterium]MBT4605731.1 o-succinylbenzoate synthase [Thiotrichales bacterium]MBT3472812.1 o-succinylbenzoate synthase [Gammaproteobacteria bacterium]MBT3966793.1 o-succinylbenzoate synthase [Gammaproteobacteria bacterium]MBT4079948.1 o-succinylbenzoate synthase [Gammaproteobacteria bacterium]
MMISDYTIHPYRLSFQQPWHSSRGQHNHREGFLVELKDDKGNSAIGEAAPLPEMGSESLQQCHQKLLEMHEVILHCTAEAVLQQLAPYREHYPAFCCAIESATVMLLAKQQQLTLSQWFNQSSASQLQLNQITTLQHPVINPNGASVIKLKVGIAPIETELKQLQQLAKQLSPKQQLRLDANQAWSFEQASTFLQHLQSLPIESIEEPIQNPTLEQFQQLQQQCHFPIAVDESMQTIGLSPIVESSTLQRVVLKPMLLGGPQSCFNIAQQLQQAGIEVVITSTLESSIGILSAAHCAAAIDPHQLQAHGLDTARLFNEDLTLAPTIKNGILHLP